jgi:hypothetical protein
MPLNGSNQFLLYLVSQAAFDMSSPVMRFAPIVDACLPAIIVLRLGLLVAKLGIVVSM